jgi:hypothetical protein
LRTSSGDEAHKEGWSFVEPIILIVLIVLVVLVLLADEVRCRGSW